MMYDNETGEYVYEVGMIDAPDCHWFEGLDRELYIVPGYGLTTDMVGGQEYGVVDFLNLVCRLYDKEGRNPTREEFEAAAPEHGIEIEYIPHILRRFTPEDGYYSA
jgi:protein tyrosine phosphatase (PTP) superfamily phosphohydrolase (DUF442 family)